MSTQYLLISKTTFYIGIAELKVPHEPIFYYQFKTPAIGVQMTTKRMLTYFMLER